MTDRDTVAADAEDQITRDKRDAARYRWLRDCIEDIFEDEDGLAGVAYTYQVPLAVIDKATEAELLDAVADAGIVIDGAVSSQVLAVTKESK